MGNSNCRQSAPPIWGNAREEAVFDLVPLAGTRGKMTHGDGQSRFIRELLQFQFPQPDTGAIAPATVRGNQEAGCIRVCLLPHGSPPAANALDRELCRVMVHADTDPAGIEADVVDSVGSGMAEFRNREIVDAHLYRLPFRAQFPAAVFEIAHQFPFLCVNRDNRLFSAEISLDLAR